MTFRLRIPGRDNAQASDGANLAHREHAGTISSAGIASLPPSLAEYTRTTIMLSPDAAAAVQSERHTRRRARIVWMGYVEVADQLAETLKARDRRLEDRRPRVVCAHAGPRWHCRKKQGFLTEVLQRCKYFEDGS